MMTQQFYFIEMTAKAVVLFFIRCNEKDLFRKNIQFVNTNQPQNRHYITEYKLTKVPTFIHLKYGKQVEKYTGTNIEKIDQVIRGD